MLALASVVLALGFATTARAEPPSAIVLIEPNEPNALARETLTRARAELAAAGFRVVIAQRQADDTRLSLEAALKTAGAVAAIAIESRQSSSMVEVWVSDQLTGKLSIRPVDVAQRGETPALLAIRAVELLRASLIELTNPPRGSSDLPKPTAEVQRLIGPADDGGGKQSARTGFGIEAGFAALLSVDPPTPAVAPELRFSYGAAFGIGARLTWIGPSFGPSVAGELGQASTKQFIGLAEIVFAPPVGAPVTPLVSAGLGAYHIEASGELTQPAQARQGGSTSFLATWGAGLDLQLVRHLGVALETFAGVAGPAITIDMGAEQVGRFGRPLLGASLGVVGLF